MNDQNPFKIIIIDDNPSIHHDFVKILKTKSPNEIDNLSAELFGGEGATTQFPEFEIDAASQGKEGVLRIKAALDAGKPYALAFVDIRMPPGWDGIETIKHIWEINKDIQIVICTAYSDYSWEDTVKHLGKTDNLLILKKPFDNVSVRQLACALTKKWELTRETKDYTTQLQQEVSDRTMSLQKSLSLLKSTFESSSDAIIVINKDGTITDYNVKLIEMLQIPKSTIESKSEEGFFDYLQTQLKSPDEFLQRMNELREKINEVDISVITFKNGRVFECYSQPHQLNDEVVGRIMDFRDITKRASLEKKLHHQATHDPLTGLANRVKLLEEVKDAFSLSNKHDSLFALLFLDFDRFKLINDSLSHQAGDALLKEAATRLQASIRKDDVLARLGGDEFVILLKNVSSQHEVEEKAEKILAVFHEPFNIAERKLTVTASIGISIYPTDGHSVDILLRNADTAMYRAKAKKGDHFVFYTPTMNSESLATLDQDMELRSALANNEFFLVYQPQLDLSSEKLIAVEALIRWRHPTKGILSPIDFIPTAEETGLIVPIGEWVLKTACAQNKAWQEAGLPPIRVAVNVTAQQFLVNNLTQKVASVLKETRLAPKYLEIELTENVILSNREIILAVTELKKLGVFIAIDDFGTGYSSLSYLHRIPLDRLKIDSSFIQHIQSANDDEVIIRAIISMAKNLDLEVLAEGVESLDQVNFLKKYECADVQGYYFSAPLSGDDIKKSLENPDFLKKLKDSLKQHSNEET
jgi:diguanylate cyclase (GGDEF)-like protein/PAS domain S-box-containing protein